jgi:hypothetical protein
MLLVVCPKCGAKLQKTIGWFKENREVSCPFGTKVYLVADELVRIINESEGAIGRLIRPIREIAGYQGSGNQQHCNRPLRV